MKLTELNRSALIETMNGENEAPNRIPPHNVPHLRRCIKLGLLEVTTEKTLRLTTAGRRELGRF